MNPISSVLRSKKFLLLVLDTVISLALFFVVKYANAGVAEDVKTVLLAAQPILLLVIMGITPEEVAAKLSVK